MAHFAQLPSPAVRRLSLAACAALLVIGVLPAGATAPRGSRANPYPIRTMARLPGSSWKLRVNKAIPNASLAVLGNGTYAVRPDKQFFLINVTVGYVGKSPHAVFSAYNLTAVGHSGLSFTQLNDSCGDVRNGLADFRRVAPGRRITGNICYWVPKPDARVLVLKYQSSSSRSKVFFTLR